MPFVRSLVLPYVGKTLELQPIPGWWWEPSWPWEGVVPRDQLPGRLAFRLDGLLEFNTLTVGGFGQVIEPRSALSLHWARFELRTSGDFDFESRQGACNVMFRRRAITDASNDGDSPEDYDILGYCHLGKSGFPMPTGSTQA